MHSDQYHYVAMSHVFWMLAWSPKDQTNPFARTVVQHFHNHEEPHLRVIKDFTLTTFAVSIRGEVHLHGCFSHIQKENLFESSQAQHNAQNIQVQFPHLAVPVVHTTLPVQSRDVTGICPPALGKAYSHSIQYVIAKFENCGLPVVYPSSVH